MTRQTRPRGLRFDRPIAPKAPIAPIGGNTRAIEANEAIGANELLKQTRRRVCAGAMRRRGGLPTATACRASALNGWVCDARG